MAGEQNVFCHLSLPAVGVSEWRYLGWLLFGTVATAAQFLQGLLQIASSIS
jgi:hypothetical protein